MKADRPNHNVARRLLRPADVEMALAEAWAVRAAAPRCTEAQMAAARAAWSWLALVPAAEAAILQARATGASWAAVARRAGLTTNSTRMAHARAVAAIVARLNDALAR